MMDHFQPPMRYACGYWPQAYRGHRPSRGGTGAPSGRWPNSPSSSYDGCMPASPIHVPVLAAEVIESLNPQPGQVIVDGTLGGGGHTRLLAERVGRSNGFVIALDRDQAAIAAAERNLSGLPVKVASANFSELPVVLGELKIDAVDGVLLDLGLSSDQLADAERGFSFDSSGSLDLRFNPEEGEPAWELIARLPERDLADVIYRYGEERFSRRIARRIVEQRAERPIKTASELAELVRRCIQRSVDRIDPATRTFQALRIAVNRELESLEVALEKIPNYLK